MADEKRFKPWPFKHSYSTSNSTSTGESLSEALIFASTNPQYDDRLQVQYM